MRIFFLVRTLDEAHGGGSHHNAIAQIRALRARGHDVSVHTFTAGDNASPADIALVEHEAPGAFRQAINYVAGLLRTYEGQADVYFLYGADFAYGAGAYRRQGGRTPVAVYLDTYLAAMGRGEVPFGYKLKRFVWDTFVGLPLARRVDSYFAVSPYVRDAYVKFGFPQQAFYIVPNFFDLPPAPAHMPAPELKLLYTGRLIHDKGPDLLLQTLSALKGMSWRLRLVGDGPLASRCKALAQVLGDRVEFVPWVPQTELSSHYAWADVFVHPARWPEPFGRTVVEALGAGLPVVVPRDGGASWIAGEAGIVFINGDLESLRSALMRALEDSSLRSRCASHARAAAEKFSSGQVVPGLEQALVATISRA